MTSKTSVTEAFDAVIALGSNIGDKFANMNRAIEILTRRGDIKVVSRSRDFKTPPWGKTDQDWFANAAITIATDLTPRQLLDRCQSIEQDMGRVRVEKWGPRLIDLDILTFGDMEIAEADFTVPHPHLTERAFVLAPMADVAPGLVVKGKTIAAWLRDADMTGVDAVAPNTM
jgi:2-amino-4-hydroxy-6-hydroxymethyldihydropteridine diphosphokinase